MHNAHIGGQHGESVMFATKLESNPDCLAFGDSALSLSKFTISNAPRPESRLFLSKRK